MIVKKVKNPKKSSSKAVRITNLTNYVREAGSKTGTEKCVHGGSRNFLAKTAKGQTAEMLALASEAVRSKDTINHYVLSWSKGEKPTAEHAEQAVDIFLDGLGLSSHQAIYGLHADTGNWHLHIVINRVNPETEKCVEINKGFDIKAAHLATARIEAAQGWRKEANSLYRANESGELERRSAQDDGPPQPNQTKRDKEHRTGEKSAERMAMEKGGPIIKMARTWEELHSRLAEAGMRYEKAGSGAKVFLGDIALKASSVDRKASLSKLQKRLGPYQPPEGQYQARDMEPEPMEPEAAGWEEYAAARKAHYEAREKARAELAQKLEREYREMAQRHRERREKLFKASWKGRGHLLNATRSVLAAEQASERIELKERQKKERESLRKRYPAFPAFRQWGLGEEEQEGIDVAIGIVYVQPRAMDIRDLVPQADGWKVNFFRKGPKKEPVLTDYGKKVLFRSKDPDMVLAGLQLCAQKWGVFILKGSEAFKATCVKLAAEHGFRIANPELQEDLRKARERLKERTSAERKETARPAPKQGPTM
jgi:hypothetical protein